MRVGIIGDPHEPVSRPGYLDFCTDTFKKYKVDQVVCIGDLVDWHGISFHARQPECPGTADEYHMALDRVQKWKKRFPKLKWCIGNHDERPARLARTVSIPEFMLKPYNIIWGVPDWEMDFSFVIDEVLYKHGTGISGVHPAWNLMNKAKMSVVMGHCHSRAGTKWSMNPLKRFFCMDTGCGISEKEWQFAYGKDLPERPILACGIVDDGQPISIAMPCGHGEKYHDSRFVDPNKPKPVMIGRHGRTAAKSVSPVHYAINEGETFVACQTQGTYSCTRIKDEVTCGNCKRTKEFKNA
jgi:predicted phosphodiesterase